VLEIERKFWYDFDIEKRLIGLGAQKLINKKTKDYKQALLDEYYDNFDSYFLLFSQVYLRARTTDTSAPEWQLKYPSKLASSDTANSKNVEEFFELDDPSKMIALVSNLSPKKATKSCSSVESLVSELDLKPFTRINSLRKSYVFENVRIDLDETDFGYKIGELELVLSEQEQSGEAVERSYQKLANLTSQLGLLSLLFISRSYKFKLFIYF
jgi:adenylate cyclase class IV